MGVKNHLGTFEKFGAHANDGAPVRGRGHGIPDRRQRKWADDNPGGVLGSRFEGKGLKLIRPHQLP